MAGVRLKGLGIVLVAVFALAAATGPSGAQSGYNVPGVKSVTLKLKVKRATTGGVRVKATCNVACAATVRAFKGARLIGKRTRRLPNRAGVVQVTFKRPRAAGARVKLRGVAIDAASRRSKVVRKRVRLK